MPPVDPLRLAAARLFTAPWHDADPERVERRLTRRLRPAALAAVASLAEHPSSTSGPLRRWLSAADAVPLPADARDLMPSTTAGAIFLLPRSVREEAFWAVGLLAHAGLWRTTVRRSDVAVLDALAGPASQAIRGWLDDEREPGIALLPPARIEELGTTAVQARGRMIAAGANVLMRACIAGECRAWVRAARWRMPVAGLHSWRRRVRIDVRRLNEWLARDLIETQAAEWQWVIPTLGRRSTGAAER